MTRNRNIVLCERAVVRARKRLEKALAMMTAAAQDLKDAGHEFYPRALNGTSVVAIALRLQARLNGKTV